jgi:hypothetical protein
MYPLEHAAKLRQEADTVLGLIRLQEIMQPHASIFPTGSYYLDVMVYPDIDLYITRVSIGELFEIGAQIATCEQVTQVVFERNPDPVQLPGGLYLKPRVNYGDWGRLWKIDIWSLEDGLIREKLEEMQHFKDAMTPEIRLRIIEYKLSVMTSQKRTPAYSGYYIYKAFLDEGLSDFKQVTNYLISHGIQMESQGSNA